MNEKKKRMGEYSLILFEVFMHQRLLHAYFNCLRFMSVGDGYQINTFGQNGGKNGLGIDSMCLADELSAEVCDFYIASDRCRDREFAISF